jgi:hypothetical protein
MVVVDARPDLVPNEPKVPRYRLAFGLHVAGPADPAQNGNGIEGTSVADPEHAIQEAADLVSTEEFSNINHSIPGDDIRGQPGEANVTSGESHNEVHVLGGHRRIPSLDDVSGQLTI